MKREEAIDRLMWLKDVPHINDDKWIEAIDMAIKSLQREIPKNPIVNYVADSDGSRRLTEGWKEDALLCPVCHTYFGEVFNEGYCRECGQKIVQKRVKVVV